MPSDSCKPAADNPKVNSLIPSTSVRFWLPAEVRADTIALVGDFNDWSTDATMMERDADGEFVVDVVLETGTRITIAF